MNKFKAIFKSSFVVISSIIIVAGISFAAGSLNPVSSTVTNTSYTLTDLDNLKSNIRVSTGSGQIPSAPAGNPALTFKSISDVYGDITTELDKLTPDKIVEGTTAFGIVGTAVATPPALTWQPPISGTNTYKILCYSAGAYERTGDPRFGIYTAPCVEGDVPGTGLTLAGEGAVEYCANLVEGGNSSWRLPTVSELAYALNYNFLLMNTDGGFRRIYDNEQRIISGGSSYLEGYYWTSSNNSLTNTAKAPYFANVSRTVYSNSDTPKAIRNTVRCVHD